LYLTKDFNQESTNPIADWNGERKLPINCQSGRHDSVNLFSEVYHMRKNVIRKATSLPPGQTHSKTREDPRKLFPLNEICRLYRVVDSQASVSSTAAPLPVCAVLSLVDKTNLDSGYLLLHPAPHGSFPACALRRWLGEKHEDGPEKRFSKTF
jgi:hypothetical protein